MPTNDDLTAHQPLPVFLADHPFENAPRDWLRFLKPGVLAFALMLIGIANSFSLRNPLQPVAALLTDAPAVQFYIGQSIPTGDQMTFESAYRNRADMSEASPGGLLQQFQTWAARTHEDERSQVETMQDARGQALQGDQASDRPAQKHRKLSARAEVRPAKNINGRTWPDQSARIVARPVQDTRAQGWPTQHAQAPTLLQSLGLEP